MLQTITAVAARFRVLLVRLLLALGFRENAFLLLLAVLIGLTTAAAAVGFHELIDIVRNLLYRRPPSDWLYGPGVAMLVAFPAIGGLVVGLANSYVVRARAGHGVIDVMESVIRTSGFIKPSVALEKIFTSGITIGSGGSAGAEGPIVQIGAAIASGFGQLFQIARAQMPVIIGCGAAAGISAIFDSPIGGVLFTLEVILLDFSIRTFAPVVVASVIANVTTQAIFREVLGRESGLAIFTIPTQAYVVEWPHLGNFVVLGVCCGLAGASFTRLMHRSERWFARLPLHPALKPAAGGAAVGGLGVAWVLLFGWALLDQPKPIPFEQYPMPAFFGDGYGFIQSLLSGEFYAGAAGAVVIGLLLTLLGIKVLATCLTLSSGGSGGVIAPALFIGAVVGGALGAMLRELGWFAQIQPQVYALVGMGAALAAVVHAPMAAILITLDLTEDYKLTLPAMLAAIVATGVARRVFADSVYTLSLRQRGLAPGGGQDLLLLRRLNVEQVALEPATVVQPGDPLDRVLDLTTRLNVSSIVVTDAQGRYAGMVVQEDLNAALIDREAVPLLLVSEVMRGDVPLISTADDLASVLDVFMRTDLGALPVGLPTPRGKVVGIITRAALVRRYRAAAAEG